MLVAISLMAVLIVSLYATFFSIYRATGIVREELADYIDAGRFLDTLSRDARSAYYVAGDEKAVFEGGIKKGASYVRFTAFTRPAFSGGVAGDLFRITYSLERIRERYRVYREVTNPYTGGTVRYAVTGPLESFDVSFYNGSSWSKAWDAEIEHSAPVALKASVTLEGGEEVYSMARMMLR
jgi:type II secretory pathway component PulJ